LITTLFYEAEFSVNICLNLSRAITYLLIEENPLLFLDVSDSDLLLHAQLDFMGDSTGIH
jgi:hypothetical protein